MHNFTHLEIFTFTVYCDILFLLPKQRVLYFFVAKAAQYQKEHTTEYQSKYDVQKLVETSRSIIKNKETAKQFLLLAGIIDEDGNLSEHYK